MNYRDKGSGPKRKSSENLRKCAWCNQYLPSERYRLLICPDCRKASIAEIRRKGEKEKISDYSSPITA